MDLNTSTIETTGRLSEAARRRLLAVQGEPLFYAGWSRVVFIHYEVDAGALRRVVPFELDLNDGRAYVSLVAFTMRNMRPSLGGRLAAFMLKPIATHEFLNVRAYVRHRDELGIYFLAEWVPNLLSARLGPPLFGLPYRLGSLNYEHHHENRVLHGTVTGSRHSTRLEYHAGIDLAAGFRPCDADSRNEFLLERYTAFTERNSRRRFFRIWHPPWRQTGIEVEINHSSLLEHSWPWFKEARLIRGELLTGIQRCLDGAAASAGPGS